MPFIVVGVDGSETAYQALAAAVEQARFAGAEVRAVNVAVIPAVSGYEYAPVDVKALEQAAANIIAGALDRLRDQHGGELPVSISSDVRVGHIGSELARAAKADEGAIMIIAGSRGFGGLKSALLGSTTTFLAHHLSCPLLIIPSVED